MPARKIVEYPEHNIAQLFIKRRGLKAKGLQAGVPAASTQGFLLSGHEQLPAVAPPANAFVDP